VRDPENIDMPPDEPTARFTDRSGVLPCYKDMWDISQGQLKLTQRLKEGIKRAWREVYNECLKETNIYIADLHFTILVVDRVVGCDPGCYRSGIDLKNCFMRKAGKCTQPKST